MIRVGLVERGSATIGSSAASVLEHVDVLRALPGVEEGDLRGRATADEDALLAQQRRTHGRRCPRRTRWRALASLVARSAASAWSTATRTAAPASAGSGAAAGRRHPGAGLRQRDPFDLRGEVGVVAPAEHQCPAQWGLGPARGVGRRQARRSAPMPIRAPRPTRSCGPARAVPPGNVLLDDDVEVGAPEPERAHTAAAHVVRRLLGHVRSSVLTRERRLVPVHVGVGVAEVQARRQHLVVQRAHHLEQAGRTRRRP